jgi:hypothetical protein
MKGGGSGGGRFAAGPSSADQSRARANRNGIRNVVVDKQNVYLINGWQHHHFFRKGME